MRDKILVEKTKETARIEVIAASGFLPVLAGIRIVNYGYEIIDPDELSSLTDIALRVGDVISFENVSKYQ